MLFSFIKGTITFYYYLNLFNPPYITKKNEATKMDEPKHIHTDGTVATQRHTNNIDDS